MSKKNKVISVGEEITSFSSRDGNCIVRIDVNCGDCEKPAWANSDPEKVEQKYCDFIAREVRNTDAVCELGFKQQ